MKVATVIVGTDTERFRRLGANPERIALARRIAGFVKRGRADLCVMPAGYLAATSRMTAAIRETADQLASIFEDVDLVAGVDAARTDSAKSATNQRDSAKAGERSKPPRGGWPFWGFVSRRGRVQAVYQQRTVHPGEKTDDITARVVKVTSARVGLLICGEVYDPALAESLGHEHPDLVVDVGHRSMGRGFTSTLHNAAAAAGCCVLHAQHVVLRSHGASKWTATTRRAWAETDADCTLYAVDDVRNALWAEVKFWEVESK